MKFVVIFEDAVDADPDIRTRHMRDHLAFLERNAATVEAAGPLRDSEARGRDGLWLVDASDEEEVEALVHADPFWPTGLRASYSILRWRQVFADGNRKIHP